jgi:hypothetical protein
MFDATSDISGLYRSVFAFEEVVKVSEGGVGDPVALLGLMSLRMACTSSSDMARDPSIILD